MTRILPKPRGSSFVLPPASMVVQTINHHPSIEFASSQQTWDIPAVNSNCDPDLNCMSTFTNTGRHCGTEMDISENTLEVYFDGGCTGPGKPGRVIKALVEMLRVILVPWRRGSMARWLARRVTFGLDRSILMEDMR